MIKLVYGPKGFGKTKLMLDEVNSVSDTAKGDVVFITDKRFNSVGVKFNVRCIYAEELNVEGAVMLTGFVKGLLAGNSDIEYVFIDGIKRLVGEDLSNGNLFIEALKQLEKEYLNLKFIVSVSGTKEELPDYLQELI